MPNYGNFGTHGNFGNPAIQLWLRLCYVVISAVKVLTLILIFSVSQRLRGEIGLVAAPSRCGREVLPILFLLLPLLIASCQLLFAPVQVLYFQSCNTRNPSRRSLEVSHLPRRAVESSRLALRVGLAFDLALQ